MLPTILLRLHHPLPLHACLTQRTTSGMGTHHRRRGPSRHLAISTQNTITTNDDDTRQRKEKFTFVAVEAEAEAEPTSNVPSFPTSTTPAASSPLAGATAGVVAAASAASFLLRSSCSAWPSRDNQKEQSRNRLRQVKLDGTHQKRPYPSTSAFVGCDTCFASMVCCQKKKFSLRG